MALENMLSAPLCPGNAYAIWRDQGPHATSATAWRRPYRWFVRWGPDTRRTEGMDAYAIRSAQARPGRHRPMARAGVDQMPSPAAGRGGGNASGHSRSVLGPTARRFLHAAASAKPVSDGAIALTTVRRKPARGPEAAGADEQTTYHPEWEPRAGFTPGADRRRPVRRFKLEQGTTSFGISTSP